MVENPTPDQIFDELGAYNREPFTQSLARLLHCEPSPEAIKAFAAKYPDRWAQSVAIMARLSGFSDKIEVTKNITVQVRQMSDMELDSELARIRKEIQELRQDAAEVPEPIEGEYESVPALNRF